MSSAENDALIQRFYAAFAECDGATMSACYAPDVRFSDPAFPELRGDEAGAMWRMLTSQATDLEIELAEHGAEEETGSARWIARYTFSRTGREVTNNVKASFRFGSDGLITEHVDEFGFYRWARQAIGPSALLLGWTPLIRNAVRKQAAKNLNEFMLKEGSEQA